MAFETVLASEQIYEGRLINLRVDQVRTARGVESVREIVQHPGAVAIVPVDDQQRVLLVRQYRHAVRAELVEVPAGLLNPGEDPLTAAQRELREETGLRAGQIDRLGGVYTTPGFSTEFIHLYLARQFTPDPLALDDDEAIDVLTVPLPQALAWVRDGTLQDSKTVCALLLAQAYLSG